MATRKIEFVRDETVKGKNYKAGQAMEFDEHLAHAVVHQRMAKYTDVEKGDELKPTAPAKKTK